MNLFRRISAVAAACLLVQALAVVASAPAGAAPDGVTRVVHTDPSWEMPRTARPARAAAAVRAADGGPACATTHPKGFQLLYARPSDVASRLSSLQSGFLADAAAADDRLVAESSGSPVRFRFFCGITDVQLAHTTSFYGSSDPLMAVINDLQSAGYNLSSRKYLVWWDGAEHQYACGEGTFSDDEDPSPSTNDNNLGPDYAFQYKPAGSGNVFACGWTTVMHEMGHTLGAVMHGAPHATTNWHCTDENDVMCYRDGPGVTTTTVCNVSTPAFDCNKDDYFSTAPSPGSYLDTHWNTFRSSFLEAAPAGGSSGGVPDTTITQGPAAVTTQTSASISFTATDASATFSCSLDGATTQCISPASTSGLAEGTHAFSVVATTAAGTDATPAQISWRIDRTAPTVSLTQPSAILLTGRYIPLAWTASDVHVAQHQIRYRKASAWASFGGYTLWRTQTSAGATFTGWPGDTYCFQVNAIDDAGNQSGWSNERCAAVPLDDRSGSVSSVDRATGSSFYMGTVSIGRTAGGKVTFSGIRARSLSAVVQMCSTCRYVDVYWNGALVKKLSLYSSSAKWVHIPLRSFAGVTKGTLEFRVTSPVFVLDAVGASQV